MISRNHPGSIVPLVIVHRDGFTEYRCLDCGKPVSLHRGIKRHYQRTEWKPGARK